MSTSIETSTSPDEREDNQRISKDQARREARDLLWRRDHGTLCTLSAKVEGWPFGSVVPYAIDAEGRPAILVATIAEHSRNMKKDPRVSLFVRDDRADAREAGEDVQTFGRVTVMARARPTTEVELGDVEPRYRFRVPGSSDYARAHDFAFFTLEIERVRYIGGFGKIFWLDADAFRPGPDPLAAVAEGAVRHMNEDHRDALADMLAGYLGVDARPDQVELLELDARGLWIAGPGGARYRVDFPSVVPADDLRAVVVETTRLARARRAASASVPPAPPATPESRP
jgi:putative heme iron utilization protein